jgi:Tannase-like family of unknown function (DUF6351)
MRGIALVVVTCLCVSPGVFAGPEVEVGVVSSRPDTVSGGDALIEARVPRDVSWSAQLDGRDVTPSFRPAEGADRLLALLAGLRTGSSTLVVRINGTVATRLEITNHPAAGPNFAGPHQEPFFCETVANGLGPAQDENCGARTLVQYYYKSTDPADVNYFAPPPSPRTLAPGYKPYDPSAPPNDVAYTKISEGQVVPYIVRRETGTLNRAVYDIQFLHQPGQPLPDPWSRKTRGWNGRLVYLLGGGCRGGYRQGTFNGGIGAANEPFLSQGYATATSTLNIFGNACDDRLSAETLSMVKEHFIKRYGKPVHTIGWGDSGGAMAQYLIAQNYPGLLDGIIPYLSYPDVVSSALAVTDCSLLDDAFKSTQQSWTEEQKTAVSGFATWRTCTRSLLEWKIADPRYGCDSIIPASLLYDPVTRRRGLRCDVYDNEISVFEHNALTGFAHRPLDNVGVQYGLKAFLAGKIDAEQFVELNETIGGLDEDGHRSATRTVADPEAIGEAYERGLVVTGGGGLSEIPIIEWRPYTDDLADNHYSLESYATRARLIAANGNADNQVILTYPRYAPLELMVFAATHRWEAVFPERARTVVSQMDRWLDHIAADTTTGSAADKVVRNKPDDLADACWATNGERIVETATYGGTGRCGQLYPAHGDPRLAAGAPLAGDVLKCELTPFDPGVYSGRLNAAQLERLKAVFPNGVCDYGRIGMAQQVTRATWQRYNPDRDAAGQLSKR